MFAPPVDLIFMLGCALAAVRGPRPAATLPDFRVITTRMREGTVDAAWSAVFSALAYGGAAVAALDAGLYDEALEYGEAQCLAAQSFPGMALAQAYNNRGLAHLERGELVDAAADFNAALEELNDKPSPEDSTKNSSLRVIITQHLQLLGIIQAGGSTGDRPKPAPQAPDQFNTLLTRSVSDFGLPEQERLHDINDDLFRANSLHAAGSLAQARTILEKSVERARTERPSPRVLGIALSNLGEFCLHSAPAEAEAFLQEAVAVLDKLPSPNQSVALALYNLSIAHDLNGHAAPALEAGKRAWLEIYKAGPETPHALVILHNLAKRRIANGEAQRAKSILSHALSIYDVARSDFGQSEVEHAGIFSLYRTIVELALFLALDDSWVDEVHRLIESAKARFLGEYLRRLSADPRASPAAGQPRAASGSPVIIPEGYRARPESSVLNFFVGPNATFVSWARGKQHGAFRVFHRAEDIRVLVETFYADLQSKSRSQPWRASGAALRRVLLRDCEIDLDRPILIAPDGPLWLLPFDVLMLTGLSETGGDPLLSPADKLPVTGFAPSLTTMHQLRKHTEPISVNKSVVILSKSEFTSGSLPPLQHNAAEVNAVKQHLSAKATRIVHLDERDATIDRFIEMITDADVIHVASHAVAPLDGGQPYIVVDDGSGNDQQLLMTRISMAKLRAQVVFLSACSSALGVSSEGEGVVSVARAFMLAGCRSVIAALWPVEADATARLVGEFYEFLAAGQPAAAALQRAKVACVQKNSSLTTVAAFQIFGDVEEDMRLTEFVEFIGREL